MTNWLHFTPIAYIVIFCWLIAIIFIYSKHKKLHILSLTLFSISLLLLAAFITELWLKLERPPFRTLGETRLWYAFFLALTGFITYIRQKYKWFLAYSHGLALLFLLINLLKPETHTKELMPALQSPWFVPHVIVYMLGYALLGASSLVALKEVFIKSGKNDIKLADNLVYLGFSFITMGLIFGALWAKEAWGHYWTWDPKETWALATWLLYLLYMHYRIHKPNQIKTALWFLALAFVILLICWFGINYLPSAQFSVHTYTN
jgi:ABC-type transport system involved in cytochrome c biogenesis permease subunit